MSEKRGFTRRRTLKSGKIVFNAGMSVIDCTIRDLSPSGAKLIVETIVGIPDRFMLEAAGHAQIDCHVVWKNATSLGVNFTI